MPKGKPENEEVGKVAQVVTPIVICMRRPFTLSPPKLGPVKALELFLQLVVDGAVRVTATASVRVVPKSRRIICASIFFYSFPTPSHVRAHSSTRRACTLFPSNDTRNREDRDARLSGGMEMVH
jgi:hypothetical protein